ncbi:mitochondrial 2-enoyl thioester reductase [Actinomortierella ambigua]|uniref:enoyl-[acyl-carrier-protein] reductase n=1 Tax=Actinomortierella ambigua TaxID=1343610 RepID=A0A9P6PRF1_9FUNG|nr:mitochondrial 2-enoyl thioester reductase [Actinomortierella ambigua]
MATYISGRAITSWAARMQFLKPAYYHTRALRKHLPQKTTARVTPFRTTAVVPMALNTLPKIMTRHAYATDASQTTTATALVYSDYGKPSEVLKLLQYHISPPTKGAVQIEILAAPINPADLNQIEGVYPARPPMTCEIYSADGKQHATEDGKGPVPVAVAGNEAVGRVVQIGEGVTDLQVGDWVVMGTPGLGTWRTRANFKSSELTKISGADEEPISLVQAATLTVNPCTAYRMLRDFRDLFPGDFIIQNGANSGVGESVIQLAKAMGVKTINVIRNRPGHEQVQQRLKQLGADYILLDDQLGKLETKELVKGWLKVAGEAEPADEKTGKPKAKEVKLGFNCVGGKVTTEMARLLSKNGHLVTYGAMSRQPLILPASLQIFKNIHADGFWLTSWNEEHSADERSWMIDDLLQIIRNKQLIDVPSQQNDWVMSESKTGSESFQYLEESEQQKSLLAAVQKAMAGGHGKQVFVMKH